MSPAAGRRRWIAMVSAAMVSFAVDLVGLYPSAPVRGRDRGRIDHMAFDPFRLQHPMDPESVEACLLDHDKWEDLPCPRPRFLPKLRKALQEPGDIAVTESPTLR